MRRSVFLLFSSCVFSCLCIAKAHIVEYDLTLQLHFQDSSFSAIETIKLSSDTDVMLDATNLNIDSIRSGKAKIEFSISPGVLQIQLPSRLQNRPIGLLIYYHAKPTTGLVIHPQEVYSGFNSDSWFPCDHKPGHKAKFRLTFSAPKSWKVTSSGDEQHREPIAGDQVRYSFYQSIPISAYVFGFAAGEYNADSVKIGNVLLRYLTTGYSHSQVDSIFFDVPNILSYFDSISGKSYPYPSYTQVFTRDENEQEAVRFCMLTNDYGKDILEEPREEWLIIHEFCHQWFGNSITCADWSDFWLNEGLTTFLTACYKERKFGQDEFEREMYLAHLRYDRVRGTPKDVPIVRYNYKRSSEMGGIITYYKGALVLNYLRFIIGEKVFGNGLKAYAKKYWQRTVATTDFEREIEHASGKNLKWFFDEWVYRADSLKINAGYTVHGNSVTLTLDQSGPGTYRLPMSVTITSNNIPKTFPIVFNASSQTFSFPISDSIESILVDEGKELPVPIEIQKPYSMLMYEALHAANSLDRVDAINKLGSDYKNLSAEKQQKIAVLLQNSTHSSSRLIAQVSKNLLKKIKG